MRYGVARDLVEDVRRRRVRDVPRDAHARRGAGAGRHGGRASEARTTTTRLVAAAFFAERNVTLASLASIAARGTPIVVADQARESGCLDSEPIEFRRLGDRRAKDATGAADLAALADAVKGATYRVPAAAAIVADVASPCARTSPWTSSRWDGDGDGDGDGDTDTDTHTDTHTDTDTTRGGRDRPRPRRARRRLGPSR